MDAKLQDIMERLNRRLVEARKFQDTLTTRIRKIERNLAKLKAEQGEEKKKRRD